MAEYKGIVKARIIEVRFATSGKIARVNRLAGDKVTKGELIASLDRKIYQTELDRQLADFEKTRADFEIFNQKNPNPESAIDKYLKVEKQAALNASVKEVELAKAKLDQNDLFSPVEGIIIDDGEITAGIYITPSSSPLKIIDANSFYFEIEIEEKDIKDFENSKDCQIKIASIDLEIKSSSKPTVSDGKTFTVRIPMPKSDTMYLGLHGEANF